MVQYLSRVSVSFLCFFDSLVLLFLDIVEFVTLVEEFQYFVSFGNSLLDATLLLLELSNDV